MQVELIACILYEEGKTILPELAVKSVYDYVDKIIIVDGTDTESGGFSSELYGDWLKIDDMTNSEKLLFLKSYYQHEFKGANGKQRNVYLDYVKKNYPDSWVLVLDADEAIDGIEKLKMFLQDCNFDAFDIEMVHFIDNLCNVDATINTHHVQKRLFKVSEEVYYPESEHPIPGPFKSSGVLRGVKFYHFGYAENLFKLRFKFLTHSSKSEIHTPFFLQQWYFSHMIGTYPKKGFNFNNVPKFIRNYFKLDYMDEVLYFQNRMQVEVKHFEMMRQWLDYFKPKTVLDCGCGVGHYLHTAKILQPDLFVAGFDVSDYAIKNTPYQNINLYKDDITIDDGKPPNDFGLVMALDVLEHVPYDKLSNALNKIKRLGNNFIFSIPFLGDPNLELDSTHIIKETKEWWIKHILDAGFVIEETPSHFYFKNQLVVAKK